MKLYKLLFAIVLVNIALSVEVQAQSVAGVVRDGAGEVLSGASVWWADTTVGTAAAEDGAFELRRVKSYDRLVAGFVGMESDTVVVKSGVTKVDFTLQSNNQIESVVVEGALNANYIKLNAMAKEEVISFAGLCKMACCNLAESFENSASVTVGFSDAISGARQIQMLGLEGTYTQMLDENRPIMMGLGAPYGLSYTPGMWLNSIQVSKGVASVTAGHEAITGQINLEHRKPTDSERLFVNLYFNSELKPEANISTALPVSRDGKLSTVVLLHASADNEILEVDANEDTFRDHPLTTQVSLANRWSYLASSGVQLRWGVKLLDDSRLGGMVDYDTDRFANMYQDDIYGSEIQNRGVNGYFKLGVPLGRSVYDAELGELRSNFAVVVDYDYFNEDAYFGLNDLDGTDRRLSVNAMYNHYITTRSSFIVGVSGHSISVDEYLDNSTPWLSREQSYDLSRSEDEVGVYGEYTYKLDDRFSFIAGVRGDYNSLYDHTYFTPRGQLKWSIAPSTTLRVSGGMGYRTANLVIDNIGVMATGREIIIESSALSDRREAASTFGGSLTQQFSILKKGDATISVDYFRTQFSGRVVADYEWDDSTIHIYNTSQPSSTDSYQIDFTWSPLSGFDIFTTFRYTDSEITLKRPDGSLHITEQPLISRYKTLINLQYATNMRRWVFDATAQLNGPSRIPTQSGNIEASVYSPS